MTVNTRKRNYDRILPTVASSSSSSSATTTNHNNNSTSATLQRFKLARHCVDPLPTTAVPVSAHSLLDSFSSTISERRRSMQPAPAPATPTLHLLDLGEDVLLNIITHVMTPAKEGYRKIITEEGLRASLPVAETCKTLHNIWIRSMHDLELWVSGKLNDRGLLSICQGNGRQIHRLGIRKCSTISLSCLEQIPMLCPNLRSLDLSHLTNLTDNVVDKLAKIAGHSLHFLALHGCTSLTRHAFNSLSRYCTSLRFLDIGSIPSVDDDVVQFIASNLGTSLRTLILSNCTDISDASMHFIGNYCTCLMSLTMRGLPLLTDAGLAALCRQGVGERIQILDVLDCTGLTLGGYFSTMELYCPHVFRYLEESNYADHFGERCLRDNIIATMPGLIYRISATDAFRRRPALYFLLLDESTLRPFRVSVQSKSLNLSDFGTVLVSNFGKRPTIHTKHVLLERFGYDSPADDVENGCHSE